MAQRNDPSCPSHSTHVLCTSGNVADSLRRVLIECGGLSVGWDPGGRDRLSGERGVEGVLPRISIGADVWVE